MFEIKHVEEAGISGSGRHVRQYLESIPPIIDDNAKYTLKIKLVRTIPGLG